MLDALQLLSQAFSRYRGERHGKNVGVVGGEGEVRSGEACPSRLALTMVLVFGLAEALGVGTPDLGKSVQRELQEAGVCG